ncbi:MAG: GNAT family N-acetyltransferase [Myxococcaceae bacterium]|nr:GNAT family N-acetyltransferase [Myxococcaceae bacterium]
MSATWRQAQPCDDAQVVQLCVALNREDPGPTPVPPEHMERTLRVLREQPARGRAWVLEQEGMVLGYALLIAYWSNELGGEVLVIDELYVAEAARGQRHATRFLEALSHKSLPEITAYLALMLEVRPENTRARRLYERAGFVASTQVMKRKVR